MSAFVTDCVLQVIADHQPCPQFLLVEPLRYISDLIGDVDVPAGFQTDGPSIPQIGMSIVGYRGLRAAIVHDWLLLALTDRATADDVFSEALAVCGVPDDVALTMASAVRAWTAHLKARERQIAGDPFEGGA
jgi:hypothetical protein